MALATVFARGECRSRYMMNSVMKMCEGLDMQQWHSIV
jgi:hypothetical protein